MKFSTKLLTAFEFLATALIGLAVVGLILTDGPRPLGMALLATTLLLGVLLGRRRLKGFREFLEAYTNEESFNPIHMFGIWAASGWLWAVVDLILNYERVVI